MNFLDFFTKKKSAQSAHDRLQIILAHERSLNIPYMEDMKKEIIDVIEKYTNTSKINIKTDSNQKISTLEIEIVLNN
ncbi:MAG: cell division topological specificity factor MinE [Helicobacteraceae bacterium]|nr:cell division topological specificity factor MinE [Helicobacteraceae bacterium]